MEHHDILIDLRKIIRSVNLESKKIQKEFGLSIPQLLLMEYLDGKEDLRAAAKELKNHMKLNASTITGIISRLEKKGFVAKVPRNEDRRGSWICLTVSGRKMLERSPQLAHQKLSGRLENLDPQRRREIQQALHLLVKFLGADELEAAPVITYEEPLREGEGV